MAVKKNLLNTSLTYQDLFDTQDALDDGSLDGATVQRNNYFKEGSFFTHGKSSYTDVVANKDNFGSLLGGTNSDAVQAYKKRKAEATSASTQGMGRSQSILGGTVV